MGQLQERQIKTLTLKLKKMLTLISTFLPQGLQFLVIKKWRSWNIVKPASLSLRHPFDRSQQNLAWWSTYIAPQDSFKNFLENTKNRYHVQATILTLYHCWLLCATKSHGTMHTFVRNLENNTKLAAILFFVILKYRRTTKNATDIKFGFGNGELAGKKGLLHFLQKCLWP